jgi:hypothetical protein
VARDALRIGVAHLPPVSVTPDARLYADEAFKRDLGRAIGKRLDRAVAFEAVAGPAQAPAAGRIDLALVRLPEGAKPPAPVAALDAGYASAPGLSMRTDTDIKDWGDLAGRTVCLRPLPEGLTIGPGERLALRPGGRHLMIFAPRGSWQTGDRIPLDLVFGRAGVVEGGLATQSPADAPSSGAAQAHP